MVMGCYICSRTYYVGVVEMPYGKGHKERTRERILESAARLFPRLGFEAVSIDLLMQDAGLTRGAFYAHFANKAEVYAESMVFSALKSPFNKVAGQAMSDIEWFEQTIAHYLSREHIDESNSPCPLAFLVTDINQRDAAIRNTYTRLYENLAAMLRHRLKAPAKTSDVILAATAMMIGGVAVARALDDDRLVDRLLNACRDGVKDILKIQKPNREAVDR